MIEFIQLKEVEDDLVEMAYEGGHFDAIVQGCNCFQVMGAGIAPQINKRFGGYPLKEDKATKGGDYNKLGTYSVAYMGNNGGKAPALEMYGGGKDPIDWHPIGKAMFNLFVSHEDKSCLAIVNGYTQFDLGKDNFTGDIPVDYDAIRLVMRKINREFEGLRIGIPEIGCGLAGGEWDVVSKIIEEELTHVDATIVHWKPRK